MSTSLKRWDWLASCASKEIYPLQHYRGELVGMLGLAGDRKWGAIILYSFYYSVAKLDILYLLSFRTENRNAEGLTDVHLICPQRIYFIDRMQL